MKKCKDFREGERGNVLFLILIAVALFAALSYAVTQSTRSGGGSSEREQAILSGASMTQHPTALRTSIIRMVLSGTDVADLLFNPPSGFAALDTTRLVFHPNGGGAVFQQAPTDMMVGNGQGTWFYNPLWDIPQIGTDGAGGNDVIAFLPGVTQGVCEQVNDEFVINTASCTITNGAVPDIDTGVTVANIRVNMDDTFTFPVTNQEDLQGDGASCEAFSGQPSGCFFDGTDYVFFSALLER